MYVCNVCIYFMYIYVTLSDLCHVCCIVLYVYVVLYVYLVKAIQSIIPTPTPFPEYIHPRIPAALDIGLKLVQLFFFGLKQKNKKTVPCLWNDSLLSSSTHEIADTVLRYLSVTLFH